VTGFGLGTGAKGSWGVSAGGPGRTEESFKSGGNGGASGSSYLGGGAFGGGGVGSCGSSGIGLGSFITVCGGGVTGCDGSGISETGGGGGSGMGGVAMIVGGRGVFTTVDETDAGGGSGFGSATAASGGAISAAGNTGVSGGSGLGAAVVFCWGAGGALSATGGAGEAGLRPRILERNSVSELRFDGTACSGSGSGRIGSSNFSSQRRIWSRECGGSPANSSTATWPPSSTRETIASPSILAEESRAKEKGIFSDGRRGIMARRENPCSERSRIIPPFAGGSST